MAQLNAVQVKLEAIREGIQMSQEIRYFVIILVLCSAGYVGIQDHRYSEIDILAQKVIDTYQRISCEDIVTKRSEILQVNEQIVKIMHESVDIRRKFINRIAAPVANKLFACGLIS